MTVPPAYTDRTPTSSTECGQTPRQPQQSRVAGMAFNFSAVDSLPDQEAGSPFASRKPVQYAVLRKFQKLDSAA